MLLVVLSVQFRVDSFDLWLAALSAQCRVDSFDLFLAVLRAQPWANSIYPLLAALSVQRKGSRLDLLGFLSLSFHCFLWYHRFFWDLPYVLFSFWPDVIQLRQMVAPLNHCSTSRFVNYVLNFWVSCAIGNGLIAWCSNDNQAKASQLCLHDCRMQQVGTSVFGSTVYFILTEDPSLQLFSV